MTSKLERFMRYDVLRYLSNRDLRSPATMNKLDEVQKSLGINLPEQYANFMSLSNGYEGLIGNSYVAIWKIEDLVGLNEGYAVKEFAPHLIIFGSDGGGEAFAFDITKEMQIVNTPFIGLGLEDEKVIAKVFDEFIEKIYYGL